MNIFVLDTDLRKNAESYCDQHLVKMILETAQMMCTVVQEFGGVAPYKATHRNHPCTRWLMENGGNWDLLFDLVTKLNDEYKSIFNHTENHKSYNVILGLKKPTYVSNVFTGMFNAVTDDVRRENIVNTIKLYRDYYRSKSQNINMRWTGRSKPSWL